MTNPVIALALDAETSSNVPKTAGVCQLGAVALVIPEPNKPIDQQDTEIATIMSLLCKPSEKIHKDAAEVHGITDDDVRWALPEHIALQALVSEIEYLEQQGYDVVVGGQNVLRFDFPIFDRILGPHSLLRTLYKWDTLLMTRRLYPDADHKLGPMYSWLLDKPELDAHDAEADCRMCCEILRKLMSKENMSILDIVKWCDKPQLWDFFPFGKHKGMAMDEVPLSYLYWCHKNFKEPCMDLEYNLKFIIDQREAAQGDQDGGRKEAKAG